MKTGSRRTTLAAAAAIGLLALSTAWAAPAVAQEGHEPADVTDERVAAGEALFTESGCQNCHGADATGMPGMTSDMTDGEWTALEDPSFEDVVAAITEGLGADKTGGVPMPAMGGADLTEEQVKALAAYVWRMNHSDD